MRRDALIDLRNDLDELGYLCDTFLAQLSRFKTSLRALRKHFAYAFLWQQTDTYGAKLSELKSQSKTLQRALSSYSDVDIPQVLAKKHALVTELRTTIPLIAALATSTDWQSPTFAHTLHSEAGIQEGKILACINDYKRDRHLDETEYQQAFLKSYVDGFKFLGGAYLTSSGMAAMTTIIAYLSSRNIPGPIMIGASSYFENRDLVQAFFSNTDIFPVAEMDTHVILDAYRKHLPQVIFFDSLCNSADIAIPDLYTILSTISKAAKKETHIVIDNSTLSIALQPLKHMKFSRYIKLIVFESLNKYHQFGLDRVTGGIVWFRGLGLERIDSMRDHSGTNISDIAAHALPTPNRKFLTRRMTRHGRNTQHLAQHLSDYISASNPKKISAIIYPGLASHPSFSWAKTYGFFGSYFVIQFKQQYQYVRQYQLFLRTLLRIARTNRVSINGGTSFGFHTTRAYVTATNSRHGDPFFRVSVGTETMMEVERIAHVFTKTFQSF